MTTKQDVKLKILDLYFDKDNILGEEGYNLKKGVTIIDTVDEICNSIETPIFVNRGRLSKGNLLPIVFELDRHKKGQVFFIDPISRNINDDKQFFQTFNVEKYIQFFQTSDNNIPNIQNINLLYFVGYENLENEFVFNEIINDIQNYASKITLNGYCFIDDMKSMDNQITSTLTLMGFDKFFEKGACLGFKRLSLTS